MGPRTADSLRFPRIKLMTPIMNMLATQLCIAVEEASRELCVIWALLNIC